MNTEALRLARSLLFQDLAVGWSLVSKFSSLSVELPTLLPGARPFDEEFIRRQLLFSIHDLWMMCTGLARLEWMKEKAGSDAVLRDRWSSYASLDIEEWHTQFRSLLDYVAKVIWELAERKRQVSDSFTTLWERANGTTGDPEDFAKKLGNDWLDLLKSATWYPQIISIRDETIHRGAQTIVLGEPSDGILFQVLGKGGARLAREEPNLMFNKNVVHFDRYAAYFMARLLTWLEKFASIAYSKMGMTESPGCVNRHFGFTVLVDWIDAVIALESQRAGNPR